MAKNLDEVVRTRFKQYEYRGNSNAVLTSDPRHTHKVKATGEAESLYGRIDPKRFGDRAYRGRPADELDEKLIIKCMKKKKKNNKSECEPSLANPEAANNRQSKMRWLQDDESVLTSTTEEWAVYQPKTKETRVAADEAMLSVIQQQQLGGHPLNIVTSGTRRLKDERGGGGGGSGDRDSENGGGWLKGQRRQLVDLESISFHQGGLLIANKKCWLPVGSYRNHRKGYEEVHVPPLEAKPFAEDEKLLNISDLPSWAQPAFEGMTQLNRVESKVYETALFKADNLLICAPTGKTNVAMLTILQQMGGLHHMNKKDWCSFNHSEYKIVYVAPKEALVDQVVGNLSNRLKSYGVTVMELHGGQPLTRQHIEETQIIVTTPEKWDIVTRKSQLLVKLLIIDEVHLLLHDNIGGPALESIVARTVRQMETTKEHVRLVGLSATTLPNYEDVSLFMQVDLNKGLFDFDNSYRPCPLAQQCIGITVKNPLQKFQLMNDIFYEKVIGGLAGNHQVLIFVDSIKETTITAGAIRDTALANDTLEMFLLPKDKKDKIPELIKSNKDLKRLLPYGIAIHNEEMTRPDRKLVEQSFADGHIQVLVSTATLAWGGVVNLPPAHTVIIKGGTETEFGPLDVMQMLGHAGRPQSDTYGEGIIITGHSQLQYYLSLMNQQLPIESQLVPKLTDQLNAEIVLGTVKNAKQALHWLGYTYLYIRMLCNPPLYGLPPDAFVTDPLLEERRADLIHSAVTILNKNNMLKYDTKSGYFEFTDLGLVASYYNVTHGAIATSNKHLRRT